MAHADRVQAPGSNTRSSSRPRLCAVLLASYQDADNGQRVSIVARAGVGATAPEVHLAAAATAARLALELLVDRQDDPVESLPTLLARLPDCLAEAIG